MYQFSILIGVFFSAILEYFFPPFWGDTVILYAAYLAGRGDLNPYIVYLVSVMGSWLGAMGLYSLFYWKGRDFLINRSQRFFTHSRTLELESWIKRWGAGVIIVNRFLPGVRSILLAWAGVARTNKLMVAGASLVSVLIFNLLVVYLGFSAGMNWEEVRAIFSYITRGFMWIGWGILLIGVVIWKIRARKG